MPPKRQSHILPKACQDIKDQLGSDITGESLLQIPHATQNRAFSSMTLALQSMPDKLAEYKQLVDDAQRREWLAAFITSPESGGSRTTERRDTTCSAAASETTYSCEASCSVAQPAAPVRRPHLGSLGAPGSSGDSDPVPGGGPHPAEDALPALDDGILQAVRILGRFPKEMKKPLSEEDKHECKLAHRIRDSWQ